MRVVCSNLDEFIENLAREPSDKVFRGVVYVSRSRRPVDGNKQNAVKFAVVFQASAVINVDGGQYLLQMGEECGEDYEDATQEFAGSDQAAELKKRLGDWCDATGLVVGPGIVDF